MSLFDSDLFKFPFEAEVWGTASDWVLSIATIVTIYFIYRTFRSQIIVQESQTKLLQIEVDRFIKDNKPGFKLVEFDFQDLIKDKEDPNIIFHLKKFGDLDAIEFESIPQPGFQCEVLAEEIIKAGTDISLLLNYVKGDLEFLDNFHCFLLFKDRYGNHYRQVIHLYLNLKINTNHIYRTSQ